MPKKIIIATMFKIFKKKDRMISAVSKLIELLVEQLSMEFNDKDGCISFSIIMSEAKFVAELTKKT